MTSTQLSVTLRATVRPLTVAGATVGIGLLPTYATIGVWAPILGINTVGYIFMTYLLSYSTKVLGHEQDTGARLPP
ncbi:hypothetical protein [Rhodococcus opacus]|uniref:hypothetical protein n=1 Tax=Rhodococcus opacus TaxID=37919 RepID=UPI001F54625A|nr:hypothetical protein [Rhodococcus opacus]